MKGKLNGGVIEYSDLTWAQLCDPTLAIIYEPEVDLINPPKLNAEAERERDKAFEFLVGFCRRWGGATARRLLSGMEV